MHRRKELYGEDADCFRPERWEARDDNAVDLKNIGWGYLPFNGGPRICLGRKSPHFFLVDFVALTDYNFLEDFALLEAAYVLVRLIQRFPYFNVPNGDSGSAIGDEKQIYTILMSSGEGCWVTMKS